MKQRVRALEAFLSDVSGAQNAVRDERRPPDAQPDRVVAVLDRPVRERADGTTRILDVHLQLLLEDPWIDEDTAGRSLLGVTGSAAVPGPIVREDVLRILAVVRGTPTSIGYSLTSARENARCAREIVSSELWECLNTTAARVPRWVASDKVHDFFTWVRERTALAVGIMDSGASRSTSSRSAAAWSAPS